MQSSSLVYTIGNDDLIFHEKDGFWGLKCQPDFDYSDGKTHEKYLYDVLCKVSDKSTTSIELSSYIKDWPSEYHFSSKRHRLLSPLSYPKGANVLEVGCGCGAITRFLGESFDNVLSIEGSPMRAKVAAKRCEDLSSVKILCAPFDHVEFKKKFDIVFCVGVLEYAPSFVNGDDPVRTMLTTFNSLLSEKGVLVLALENQLGLCYLSGCKEDHTNRAFEGVEGYPFYGHKVRTFGRKTLQDELKQAGFVSHKFLCPFPDYKLPELLIDTSILKKRSDLNFGELVGQFSKSSHHDESEYAFSQKQAWIEIGKNNLIGDLANSFLVVSGKQVDHLPVTPSQDLIFWSPASRRSSFQTVTSVFGLKTGKLEVSKVLCSGKSVERKGDLLCNSSRDVWAGSYSMSFQWHKIIYSNISVVDFSNLIIAWLQYLSPQDISDKNCLILGDSIDKVPWNLIQQNSENWKWIDQEWQWANPLPLHYIMTRGLVHFFDKYAIQFDRIFEGRYKTLRALILDIGSVIFADYSSSDLDMFCDMEAEFHSLVFDRSKSRKHNYFRKTLKKRRQKLF